MPLLPHDRERGHAERAARATLVRLNRIQTIGAPIRPETRDALLSAVLALPSAPVKTGVQA